MTEETIENKKEYGHIAVGIDAKNRFDYLIKYLMTEKKPRITQEDLLNAMMDLFEKYQKTKE